MCSRLHKGYESTLSIWYAQDIVWLYDLECKCSRLHKGYESTLSILYAQYIVWLYLSYKWQDMIKVLGVEIPSYAGQWARLGAYR